MKKVMDWRQQAMGKKGERKYEYRTITKEQAKELLANVNAQRERKPSWVGALRRTMDNGLWDCSGGRSPVAIDWNGKTINGQNRLAAFIDSKLETITFLFVSGCDPEDYKSFDSDTWGRSTAQVHRDVSFAARDMARLKWLDKIVSADMRSQATHSVLEHLHAKTWRKEITWAAETVPTGGGQGKAAYVAPLMYVRKVAPSFAEEFAKSWANGGAGLPTQVLKFRDAALHRSSLGGAKGNGRNVRSSLKLLNLMAMMHQRKPLPPRVTSGLAGLSYFSKLAGDGAAKRWSDTLYAVAEE